MNRFKAEEARKRHEARDGLSELEIKALDREDELKAEIEELARKIHIDRFPEEYDHYHDSIADASDRRMGINPMRAEYIAKVTDKRLKEGVPALGSNGMPTSDHTWKIAHSEAEARLIGKSRN